MLNTSTGNRVHNPETRGNDSYNTHPVAVRALLAVEQVPTMVWEPSAGGGFIVGALQDSGRTVIATDLTKRKRGFDCTGGVDFLAQTRMRGEAILTNPPFKICDKYVAKALELSPRCYLLLRVGYLAGLRWTNHLAFGKHCARVWVFTPRLPMMHRKNHKGSRNENSAMDFAWYVFERDELASASCRPGPHVSWLDWRDYATPDELADVKARRKAAAKAIKEAKLKLLVEA
jgi:hypothetical protein